MTSAPLPHTHVVLTPGRGWPGVTTSLSDWQAHGRDHEHYWPACSLGPEVRTVPW